MPGAGMNMRFLRATMTHVMLLTISATFLFPFAWMFFTSIKTDDELARVDDLPSLPSFRAVSPYALARPPAERPDEVSADAWKKSLPTMTDIAHARVAAVATSGPQTIAIDAATALVVERAEERLPATAFTTDVTAPFTAAADATMAAEALDDALGRVELSGVEFRTNDAQVIRLVGDPGIGEDGQTSHPVPSATAWKVTSGSGTVTPCPGGVRLAYDFARDPAPVVIEADLPIPATLTAGDLHALAVSMRADDSWHRVDAEIVAFGTTWHSERSTWLGQARPFESDFQPPGFDDQTFRARTWIPLIADPAPCAVAAGTLHLRLTIRPSGTLTAIYGKLSRNYTESFRAVPFWLYVRNSLIIVALTTMGAVFSTAFVAYAFARLRWPGRSIAFGILLATMMLPSQVTMVPNFLVWRALGWYNTWNPLWVPAWLGNAFFIFLMVQHMRTLPKELEEAARIDGLNRYQTWWYIILPQVKPVLAAVAVMTFMGAWNEFMGPLIMLRDQNRFPLSLGLFGMSIDNGGGAWQMLMAGNLLMTLPALAVFFIAQRSFVQGMSLTGVKG